MAHTKEKLRKTALDIIFKRIPLPSNPYQRQRTLGQEVAQVLAREEGSLNPLGIFPTPELPEEDMETFQEVFWDLVLDRIIVPDLSMFDSQRSTFRVRSDANRETL